MINRINIKTILLVLTLVVTPVYLGIATMDVMADPEGGGGTDC